MGCHSHGPVSTAAKRLIDGASTGQLADWTADLSIDTADCPDDDLYDYFRQKIIDHFADLAGERK